MDKREYQKNYKKYHYGKTRTIVTFPLFEEDHKVLKERASKSDMTANKMAKEVLLNFIENKSSSFQTAEQTKFIQEYMRISRGIATNINQMSHSANIGTVVDVNILISSLKRYEDEFRNLLTKLD